MNCDAVEKRLSAYVDGELGRQEVELVRSHLANCSSCHEEVVALADLRAALSTSFVPEPSFGFEERLVANVMGRTQELPKRKLALGWVTATAAAFALLAGILSMRAVRLESQVASNPTQFEFARDQAYAAGSDPFTGGGVLPASYEAR